jgi:hypothetical protein
MEILDGTLREGDTVVVNVEKEKLTFRKKN